MHLKTDGRTNRQRYTTNRNVHSPVILLHEITDILTIIPFCWKTSSGSQSLLKRIGRYDYERWEEMALEETTTSTEVANYGDKSMVKSEIRIFHDLIG